NLVTERDQFFGEPRHHALRSPVKLGWNSFGQRRNLCDVHITLSLLRKLSRPATIDNVKTREKYRLGVELIFAAAGNFFSRTASILTFQIRYSAQSDLSHAPGESGGGEACWNFSG